MWAIPLATLVFLATNEGHHLFYSSTSIVSACGTNILDVTPGPWFWVNWVFAISCLGAGLVLLLSRFPSSTGPYRRQVFALLTGLAVPAAANIAYILGVRPCGYFDITPLAFSISGIAGAWGIRKHRLLDLSPVNCKAVFGSLDCPLFVFDKKGSLVEINPAAKKLVSADSDLIGESADKIFRPWRRLKQLATSESFREPVEIRLPAGGTTTLHDGGPPTALYFATEKGRKQENSLSFTT